MNHCQLCHENFSREADIATVTITVGVMPALSMDLCFKCGTPVANLYLEMAKAEVMRHIEDLGNLN